MQDALSQSVGGLGQNARNQNYIAVPIRIQGEEFLLEMEDIKKIEKINIDPSVASKKDKGTTKRNILDSLNEDASVGSGYLAQQDKKFFNSLFDELSGSRR